MTGLRKFAAKPFQTGAVHYIDQEVLDAKYEPILNS